MSEEPSDDLEEQWHTKLRESLLEYRQEEALESKKSQESYDKALLSLSGGAIGISFAFVENFLNDQQSQNIGLLTLAWLFWAASLAFTLYSFYFAQQAHENTVRVIDQEINKIPIDHNRISREALSGTSTAFVKLTNKASGICFIAGVIFLIWFVNYTFGATIESGK